MRGVLGTLALVAVVGVAGCGDDGSDHASETSGGHSSSSPSAGGSASPEPTGTGDGSLADVAVATLGSHPCPKAMKSSLDEAIASGGVWMPSAEPALMDDLEQAWTCAPNLPALQWPDLIILFLPEAPSGSPRVYFEEAADRLGRGTVEKALGSPALVLEPEGDQPAEVDVVMGDTHIVLVGRGATTGSDLLEVAASMAPLH
jgi:hypothetical protein